MERHDTIAKANAPSSQGHITYKCPSSTVTPSDDVSAITTPTGIQVPAQVAQVQRDQLTAQQTSTSATVTSGPFGGRASHRG
jgi:hypothetical protein